MNRKYQSARYHRKKKTGRPSRRRGFSKIRDEDLYLSIKSTIESYINTEYNDTGIKAEPFANHYNVPIHRITQVFKKLNQEGFLSRKKSIETGAMVRNDPIWNASFYYLRSIKGYPLRFYSKQWW